MYRLFVILQMVTHFVLFTVAPNLSFSRLSYDVDENAGPAQPVLVLSNPSSFPITVQVTDTENTATGE